MEDVQQFQRTLGALLFLFPVVRHPQQGGRQIILHGLVQTHLDVVDDAQLLEQTDVLEGARHAHAVDLIGLFPGGGHPIDQDGEQVEHGGLACAVGADQTGDLVAADHQVKVVHSGQTAEVDTQLTHVQNGLFVLVAVGQKTAGGHTVQSGLELTHGQRPPFWYVCGTVRHSWPFPRCGSGRNRSCPAVRPGGRSSSAPAPANRPPCGSSQSCG